MSARMDYYYDYYNLVKSEMINVTFNLLKKKAFMNGW